MNAMDPSLRDEPATAGRPPIVRKMWFGVVVVAAVLLGGQWVPQPLAAAGVGQEERSLDSQIDAFLDRVDSADPKSLATLRADLGSLAGKLVLGRRVDDHRRRLRFESMRRLFQSHIDGRFVDHDGKYRLGPNQQPVASVMVQQGDQHQSEVDRLRPLLKKIGQRLVDRPWVNVRLKQFLARTGAPEAVYAELVYDSAYGNPLPEEMASFFVKNGNGRYEVAMPNREAAGQYLNAVTPLFQAMKQACQHMKSFAEKIPAVDPLHARAKELLSSESLFTVTIGSALLKKQPSISPGRLDKAVAEHIKVSLFERKAKGKWQIRDAKQFQDGLDGYDRVRAVVAAVRGRVWAFAQRIEKGDPLNDGWRRWLKSDLAILLLAGKIRDHPIDPTAVFLKKTRLGRALVKNKNGSWRVNPYRQGNVQRVLDSLNRTLQTHKVMADSFNKVANRIQDARLRKPYQSVTSQLLMVNLLKQADDVSQADGFRAWIEQHFEEKGQRYTVRHDAKASVDQLLKKIEKTQSHLTTQKPAMTIELAGQKYDPQRLDLFRSSSFFNPRTLNSHHIYHTEFKDHHTARVWGLFEWNGQHSTDADDFLARIRARQAHLAQLAKTHDNLIIVVAFMPSWLSRSQDEGEGDGLFKVRNGCRPSDYRVWNHLIREVVTFLDQFKGTNFYYEIWNEPDGGYWQEGVDAYLELYEQTVRTIRRTSPKAKIGGAGVNMWNGKAQKSPGRDPINIELIRFAKAKKLPLDFISWHQYIYPTSTVLQAKDAYTKELKKNGYKVMPEFVISEWNVPFVKGTPYAAAVFVQYMRAFYQAGIDLQTFGAWEEFSSEPPVPDGFGPWGLITQQGERKPVFYVHKFFDRLSRDSAGIAMLDSADRQVNVVVSKKGDDVYELLVSTLGNEAPLVAAIGYLKANGVSSEAFKAYGEIEQLEQAIRTATPLSPSHRKVFKAARDIYDEHAKKPRSTVLQFANAGRLEVLDAQSVKTALRKPEVYTQGNQLVCDLAKYEVMWLRIRQSTLAKTP